MDLEQLANISKLFIPVIAFIAAYIAYSQNLVNREKVKFDLFDRRFKIYQSIDRVLSSLAFGSNELEKEDYSNFVSACNESIFLLPEKASTRISEIKMAVLKRRAVERKMERRNYEGDEMEKLRKEEDEIYEKFDIYQKELIQTFSPYLKIENI